MKRFSPQEIFVGILVLTAFAILFSVTAPQKSVQTQTAPVETVRADADKSGPGADAPVQTNTSFSVIPADNSLPATSFTLPTTDGRTVSLDDAVKSGPVVIDFWATWCGPCRMELPELDRVYEKYKSRGVQFFAINSDDDPKKIAQFFSNDKLGFPVLVDTNAVVHTSYRVDALPTMVIVDRRSRIRSSLVGFDPDTVKDLPDCLDALLKEQ